MVALVLLDVSAAFDVIDHKILQTRLDQVHEFLGATRIGTEPRKYCLSSKPIGAICSRHNLLYHVMDMIPRFILR